MKKIIALLVFAVMILLTFSSCTNGDISSTKTSSTEVSSNESTSSESVNLSDEELVKIVAQRLNIPNDIDFTYKIDDTYIWEAADYNYKEVAFFVDGYVVAGACVDPVNGELLEDIYKYDITTINFYRYFKDRYFACSVAMAMGKAPHEAVTEQELASFTGKLFVRLETKSLDGIGYLKSITELGVSKSEVGEIPSEISNCKNLKRLDFLKAYFLERLPESIGELENLEFINLTLSGVDKLPDGIGNLKKLKYLYAGATSISVVPESIGECESLVVLDLHSTKTTKIPDNITKLKNLKSLDLGQLNLTSLPENMGNLTELIRLDLFGSDIKQLPQSMKNLKKLEYLNVYDNYNLNEDYKQWFKNECYKCTTDPENSKDWDSGI